MKKFKQRAAHYLKNTSDRFNSAVYAIPVLLLYNVGLILTGNTTINGADFLTVALLAHFGYQGFLIFNLVLLAASAVLVPIMIKKKKFSFSYAWIVCIEGLAYSLLMMFSISFIIEEAEKRFLSAGLTGGTTILEKLTISAGAGFWEEALFRAALLALLAWLFNRFVFKKKAAAGWLSYSLAIIVTSLLFSGAHYLGSEPFSIYSFSFRAIAGVMFSIIFTLRGFALAVYTHAIYDILVLI
ncbi:MAG: CPBP family intramembrane metalloprotease [Deltaproteobacteria bacterium]|nr:CPBP family intramembrane metalloprotease [Deltaproteobacteria bacterium]